MVWSARGDLPSNPASVEVAHESRYVICGARAFPVRTNQIAAELSRFGISAISPDFTAHGRECRDVEEYEEIKRVSLLGQFARIRDPRTIGVIVANFEQHQQMGYVAPSTFAEIAVAFEHGKEIFLMERAPPNYADDLWAWGAIDLRGSVEPILQRHTRANEADH